MWKIYGNKIVGNEFFPCPPGGRLSLIESKETRARVTENSMYSIYVCTCNIGNQAYRYRLDAVYLYGHDVLKAFARSNTVRTRQTKRER